MTAQEMWQRFTAENHIAGTFEAWYYGEAPDELAELTLKGIKTATAGLRFWYEKEHLPLPETGDHSVVLDSSDRAVCVIRTVHVYTVPFSRVSASHAWKEGEGDRSLKYWREVHERFFRGELAEIGVAFHDEMDVVCEEFVRVYP